MSRLIAAILVALAALASLVYLGQKKEDSFQKIQIGDTKSGVLEQMGAASNSSSQEVLLLPSTETSIWNHYGPAGIKTYRVVFIADRVISKSKE